MSVPTMSMGDKGSNVGVGNYKGVMLCNRPFGGTSAGNKQMAVPDKSTFACGVIPESIGINIPISSKDKHKFDRPKKDTVITKHRKWLTDLQRKKEMLEVQYMNEMAQRKEEQDKFMEREAKMRQMAIALARGDTGDDGASPAPPPAVAEEKQSSSLSSSAAADNKSAKGVDAKTDDKRSFVAATSSEAKGGSSGGAQAKNTVIIGNVSDSKVAAPTGSSRPAWALTETAAAVASEDKLAGDEDDLLNFAASLDFDRYMGDVEVRVMIDGLRKRIVDLEREAANDDDREAAQEERAAKKEMLTKMIEDAMALGAQQEEKSEMEKNIAAARAILATEEGSDLHAIHSSKSVTAMIKTSKDKMHPHSGSVQVAVETSKVYNEPLIVSYDPEEGARLEKNRAVSNLPYMHRNPAV